MSAGIGIDLSGRTVVIGGAGGEGIGTATAERLGACGADLIIVDLNRRAMEPLRDLLDAAGVGYSSIECDLRDESEFMARLDEAASSLAPLYGVVSVAGGLRADQWGPTAEIDIARFDEVIALNLRASLITLRVVANRLIVEQRNGAAVAISSVAGMSALPYGVAYASAKAGLNALIRTAAIEWGRNGIRVNAVAPGSIRTGKNAADDHLLTDAERAVVPLGRRGLPTDVADAAVFLLSDLSSWITGQVLAVDGGSSVRPSFLDEEDLPVFIADRATRKALRGAKE